MRPRNKEYWSKLICFLQQSVLISYQYLLNSSRKCFSCYGDEKHVCLLSVPQKGTWSWSQTLIQIITKKSSWRGGGKSFHEFSCHCDCGAIPLSKQFCLRLNMTKEKHICICLISVHLWAFMLLNRLWDDIFATIQMLSFSLLIFSKLTIISGLWQQSVGNIKLFMVKLI